MKKEKSYIRRVVIFHIITLIAIIVMAQTKEITILAVNDMHASIDRFPKFAALVDSMRTVYPNLLLFSAGDNRTGNPVNDMHPEPSYPMTMLMNKVGFNLSVIGNHEFDSDIDGLRTILNRSDFRHICANMYAPDSLRLHIEPYKIFEVDDIRIAVLGLIHQGENGFPDAHPDKMKNISFRSPLEIANQYVWLKYISDVFIILLHERDEENIRFANQYPFADLLITGHSHTLIEQTELHNNVLITQAESQLKYVTHITLQFIDGKISNKEARVYNVDAFLRKDTDVQMMVDGFNNNELLHRVLTQAITDFSSYEELGYMMTDAIKAEAGADIAFQNPGGVRLGSFTKGPITVKDIYQLDPFGNEVIEYNLTGNEVLRLIETSYLANNNHVSYVSGITYEIELDREKKIKNIQVRMEDGSRFNPLRTYKVVMNSYLAAIAKYEKVDEGRSLFRTSADLTIEYLEKQPAVDYKGVKRITINN